MMKADFKENFTIIVESFVLFSDNLVKSQRENEDIYIFLDNVSRFYRVEVSGCLVEIRLKHLYIVNTNK